MISFLLDSLSLCRGRQQGDRGDLSGAAFDSGRGEEEEEEEGQKTKVARRVAKGEKEGAAAEGVHQCESPEAGKSVDKAGEETAGRKRNQRTKVRN